MLNIITLKSRLGSLNIIEIGTIREIAHELLFTSRILVTILAIFYIISEKKQDVVRKSRFLILHKHSTPPLGGHRQNIAMMRLI